MSYSSINGISSSALDVNDRGLAYGDGLFTTAKIVKGKIELLDQHLKRLFQGCSKLFINLPAIYSTTEKLSAELTSIAKRYNLAVIKIIITAGSGGRGYSRIGLKQDSTNVIIRVFDFPQYYNELATSGIILGVSKQQLAISPMLGGVKHLNRLEQVLLRKELDLREEDDLVVLNAEEQVVEVTSANIFYWSNNKLYTPDVSRSGVDGLMRQFIMIQYYNFYKTEVIVTDTKLSHLDQADEIFTCNSITGILPVKQFNHQFLNFEETKKLNFRIQELLCV
jgi:4-amino-4-deoxychorismate lyase